MPPRKKVNPNDVSADIDDLLAPEPETAEPEDFSVPLEELEPEDEVEDVGTDEESERIAALEARLAQPVREPAPSKFVPYSQLTPGQKKVRDLEDQIARRETAAAEQAPVRWDTSDSDDSVMVHVLEDGFTAQGVVWYRGQEIRFVRGSEAYEQTKNRDGESWLDQDDSTQYERYGKKMFGLGPWPGKKWGDVSGLTDQAEINAVRQAAAREARRRAAAPIVRT